MRVTLSTLLKTAGAVVNAAFIAVLSILMVVEMIDVIIESKRKGWSSIEIDNS